MLLTPTYHVFHMYQVHQDADLLSMTLENEEYRFGNEAIPQVASASVDQDGKIHISICNLSHDSDRIDELQVDSCVAAIRLPGHECS